MKKLLTFLLTALLAFGVGWAASVATYTVTGVSSNVVSGTLSGAPSDVTIEVTEANGFNNSGAQITTNYSPFTIKVKGFTSSYKLLALTLRYCTNSSKGAGTVTAKLGNTSLGNPYTLTKSGGTDLRSAPLSIPETVFDGNDLVITVNVTANSVYVNSLILTYDTNGSATQPCAAPTFSPDGGSSTSGSLDVTISSATEGATIYYTTDNTDPVVNRSTSSIANGGTVHLTESCTLKAMAAKSGMDNSTIVTSQSYSISSGSSGIPGICDATIAFKSGTGSNDAGSAMTANTIGDNVESGSDYISSFSNFDKVYLARSGYGWKLGSSGAIGKFTVNLVTQPVGWQVTKIVVEACRYGATEGSLKVSTNVNTQGTVIDLTPNASFTEYEVEFDGSDITSFTIETTTTAKRAFVKSITLYYDGDCGTSTDPELSVSPNELSINVPYNESSASATFTVMGSNLTSSSVSVDANGADFSVSPTSIPVADGSVNQDVTVTYNGTSTTPVTGTVTVTSGDLSQTVTVTAQKELPPPPTMTVSTNSLTVGANGNSFNVTAANLTEALTVTASTGFRVNPTSLATDATYPAAVNVTYTGQALSATGDVTVSNTADNLTETVNVTYVYDGNMYIVGDVNNTSWDFVNGVPMTRNQDGTYSAHVTAQANGWYNGVQYAWLYFTKAVGSEAIVAANAFGPLGGDQWGMTPNLYGQWCDLDQNGDVNTIYMNSGSYEIVVDPVNNKFKITPDVAAPVITPATGTYHEAQEVTITCSTPGATIYYTTDGTTPTTSSSVYNGPFTVDATTVVTAIAVSNGLTSDPATSSITIKLPGVGDFYLVTDADDLAEGNEIIFVNSGTATTSALAMSTEQKANNRGTTEVAVTTVPTVEDIYDDMQIAFLEGNATNGWYFNVGDDNDAYLYAASSSSNYLRTQSSKDNNAKASIQISETGVATIEFQGDYTHNSMRFNGEIVSCYASGQSPVYIYKRGTASPSIKVEPATMELVIPAGGTSQQGTVTVTERNTTETTVVTITGDDASHFNATLENGTLTVTYDGTATADTPDAATITLTNGTATADLTVSGYRLPVTVTITPADGHTFQGSTVNGLIESNVEGATIEYSFDGTTWVNYNADDGFTATVSTVGGTVTVYARATASNGQTATAQATYTRVPKTTTCTANIVFAPTSNNGEMSQWSTFVTHIGDGSEYLSSTGSSVSKLWTNQSLAAMRFGSGNYTGELVLALDLTKFETDACKLAKVTINAARYSNDGDNCALKVSTSANSTGVTKNITASEDQFADYVFNFDGDEVSSITIENTSTSNGRVYVHSITLEYNCGASLEAPAISPASGTYYDPQTVTITTEETGATIYYTTDGSNPADANNENRNEYTGTFTPPFTAGSETTIIAIVEMIEDGETVTSDPTSVTYTWGMPSVNIVPDSRNVASESVTVSMTGTPSGAAIYYTTDGNTPTMSSTQYDGAFTVDLPNVGDHVTVNAIAVYNGVTSEMASATYTRVQKIIDVNAPFFSPLEGKEGGYSGIYYGNQTLQIATSTENADIYFVIDSVSGTNPPASVSDPTKSSTHYTGPISMTVGKSYRVKAIAYIGDFVSTISEGYYIIKPFEGGTYVYQNLKDFNENCPTGKTASFVNPVQVVFMSTYQNNGHSAEFCYIRDNTDYACVYFGKNYTGSSHIFKMGDWIDGSQISGKTNIWEENFHIQLGTSYHEVYNWPSEALGWSEIIPETTTCQQISSGTAEGDNLWGHYIHARYTTIEGVEDDSDGKYKGTINDQSGVDTYYDKFYRWSGFTNSLGDYDQTFFSTKKNAGATFDVYGIVDYYASDYPKAFQVCPIDFLWIYKPVITPSTNLNCTSEQVVEITVTTPEWVEEGVTPTIYYKTDDMDDWAEYSGPFVVNSNTHVQAYAELESRYDDMMRSVIVETEYKFIGIKDPEIDPASMVIEVITGNEKVEGVVIADNNDENSGAVTVYTTDGSMPSATNGTQIAAGGIVELDPITETTTVTAISYLPDGEGNPVLWSNPVTVTYTFVKSNGVVYDLVDAVTMNKVYVIVNKDAYMGLSTAQNGNNRGSTGVKFTDGTKEHVYGNDELALFVLESANAGRYYFKNINGNGYLTVTTNDVANLSTSATTSTYSEAEVSIDQANGNPATIRFNYDGTNRYLRYFAKGRTFTTNSDATLNQDVFLYGTTATPLAVIESKITAGDNVQVTVADNLIGAWAVNGNGHKYLWAKDMGLSIDKTAPVAGQKDYVKNILHYQNHDWDQSNWVILDFSGLGEETDPEDFVGKKLTGGSITGWYVDDNNYRIVLVDAPGSVDDADADAGDYPGYGVADVLEDNPQGYEWGYNTYIPTNFYDDYMNAPYGEGFVAEQGYALGTHAGDKLFFMNPKVQEVARVWGVYTQKDGKDVFTCFVPSLENMVNGWGIKGAFAVEWDYNRVNQTTYGVRPSDLSSTTDANKAFMFHAAIVAKPTGGRRADAVGTADDARNMSDRFVIYPLDFESTSSNVVTGVQELKGAMKAVESVRYYNMMGMESKKPFEGINIVVTRYTDGSTSTTKILR